MDTVYSVRRRSATKVTNFDVNGVRFLAWPVQGRPERQAEYSSPSGSEVWRRASIPQQGQ